jgi:hypothetical protein
VMSSHLLTLKRYLLIDNWGQTLNFNCLMNGVMVIFDNHIALLLCILVLSPFD